MGRNKLDNQISDNYSNYLFEYTSLVTHTYKYIIV